MFSRGSETRCSLCKITLFFGSPFSENVCLFTIIIEKNMMRQLQNQSFIPDENTCGTKILSLNFDFDFEFGHYFLGGDIGRKMFLIFLFSIDFDFDQNKDKLILPSLVNTDVQNEMTKQSSSICTGQGPNTLRKY